jgi:hypothetical protein
LLLTTGLACAEVRIDAYAEPDGDVYLGQRVRLVVDVRTETWFTTAPRYPELKIDGTIALLPEAFGINFTNREGATTWAGQRQRYVLFPQRVGQLTVPPIDVPLAVSTDGKAGQRQVVTTPSVTINVVAPPGSADVPAFVTTPRLRVTEEWNGELQDLKVGDAITRRITQSADDVFALLLPAIEFGDIEGFGVYPGTPELADRVARGSYSAVRTDQVTYVMQAKGDYEIPAIEIHWFDLGSKTMTTEMLDALEITVLPNPDAVLGQEELVEEEPSIRIEEALRGALDWLAANIQWLTLLAGALFALRWLWRRFVPGWIRSVREARERRRQSEARYFDELIRAVRSGDEDKAVACFWRWADRLPGREPPLSIAALEALDPELQAHLRAISSTRYASREARSKAGRRITVARVRRLRRRWLASCRPGNTSVHSGLRPGHLNP